MTRIAVAIVLASGCAHRDAPPRPKANTPGAAPTAPSPAPVRQSTLPSEGDGPASDPAPEAAVETEISTADAGESNPAEAEEDSAAGCWMRNYGAGPEPGTTEPSLPGPMPGCEGCEALEAGPEVVGLHPAVIQRLRALEQALPSPPVDEPVLWVNSGAREGPPSASMHNQAMAADVVICGLDTRETAEHLRAVGFTCVIEYYDRDGNPCNMAHGDLRGTALAEGAYAPDGRKADTCPEKAIAKGSCQQATKSDWNYAPSSGSVSDSATENRNG